VAQFCISPSGRLRLWCRGIGAPEGSGGEGVRRRRRGGGEGVSVCARSLGKGKRCNSITETFVGTLRVTNPVW